jgi:small subunit ribosomal protein S2
VIPGNDDALRAIRLFTSKISDSAAEGVNLVGDKQFEQPAEVEAPAELVTLNAEGEEVGDVVDDVVDLEAVLGGGIRKAPGVVSALDAEPETAETAL